MSSDLEARLRRAEQLAAVLARQLGALGPIGQTLGNVAQQLASSGGWGSTYTGGSEGVVQDAYCGVSLPSTLNAAIVVGGNGPNLTTSTVLLDLDWNGSAWSGCVLVDYPGPTYWKSVAGVWTFAGYDDAEAVDGTPVFVTIMPGLNPVTGLVQTYHAEIGQLIDTNVTVTEIEPIYSNNFIELSYGATPFYCPVAGSCSATPNYLQYRALTPTCEPWGLEFGVSTPPYETDGAGVVPGRGQDLVVTVSAIS